MSTSALETVQDVKTDSRPLPGARTARGEACRSPTSTAPAARRSPRAVVEAMADYLYAHNANTHWRYPSSEETDAAIHEARQTLADFLNAESSEIVFGQNMTTLTYHLSRALGRMWGPGDEIVVTELDHHANVDPWRALERERGVTVRCVPMSPSTGTLDPEELERAVGPKTRLLALGAASNALGTINDLQRGAGARAGRGRAVLRGRRALRAARADRRGRDRLRLPGVLAVQVLRPPRRRPLGPARAARDRSTCPSWCPRPTIRPASGRRPARCRTRPSSGAAAAVDFLASLSGGLEAAAAPPARPNLCGPSRAGRRALRPAVERPRARSTGSRASARLPARRARRRCRSWSRASRRTRSRDALSKRALFVSSGDFYAWTVVQRLGHGADGAGARGLRVLHDRRGSRAAARRRREAAAGLGPSGRGARRRPSGDPPASLGELNREIRTQSQAPRIPRRSRRDSSQRGAKLDFLPAVALEELGPLRRERTAASRCPFSSDFAQRFCRILEQPRRGEVDHPPVESCAARAGRRRASRPARRQVDQQALGEDERTCREAFRCARRGRAARRLAQVAGGSAS